MAIGDPYLTVEEFRLRMGSVDDVQDAAIETVLRAASRQIDNFCAQQFNKSATATDKIVTPVYPDVIEVPNLVSVTTFASDDGSRTYATEWESTDYDLYPWDAAESGVPYSEIRRSSLAERSWPHIPRGVRITGIWGWPAVPSPIIEACYLLANRGKSLWTAPFGQTGAGEMGAGLNMTAALTPLIKEMLVPYRALVVV